MMVYLKSKKTIICCFCIWGLFSFNSCSGTAESLPPIPVIGDPPLKVLLSGKVGQNMVKLTWEEAVDVDKDLKGYELEKSTKNDTSSFTLVEEKFSKKDTEYSLGDLSEGTVYYFRIRAFDEEGSKGAYSDVISLTPFNGYLAVDTGWQNLIKGSLEEANKHFHLVVENHLDKDAISHAKSGLGWSFLRIADGGKDSPYLDSSRAMFVGSSGLEDSDAGKSILGLLLDNYSFVTAASERLKDKPDYVHKYLSHVNYRYVMIHGAFGYWLYSASFLLKVNNYLDIVDPANKPHKLNRSEQQQKLNELISDLKKPTSFYYGRALQIK